MNRIFTLLTFSEISTCDIDLIADAYGYLYMPADLERMLNSIEHTPAEHVIGDLLKRI